MHGRRRRLCYVSRWSSGSIHILLNWLNFDVFEFHVGDELLRDFSENFTGQVAFQHCFVKPDELYDISFAYLSLGVSKKALVTIQCIHGGEVRVSDADNNHRAGQ